MSSEPPPALAARLKPGERLLWWGRPFGGAAMQRRDLLLVPLAALWLGLAATWQHEAVLRDPSAGTILSAAAFIAIGLYILIGRFAVEAGLRRRTLYAVTNMHAHVISPLGRHALSLADLGRCRIAGEPAGRRTLAFGRDPMKQFQFNWSRGFTSRRPAGFLLLDPDAAEAAMAAIRRGRDG
jgi:hypothetical protein